MEIEENKIVKGQITSSGSWTTDSIHAIRGDEDKTLCGVQYKKSSVLGFPRRGELSEVTCKKCLQIIEKSKKVEV